MQLRLYVQSITRCAQPEIHQRYTIFYWIQSLPGGKKQEVIQGPCGLRHLAGAVTWRGSTCTRQQALWEQQAELHTSGQYYEIFGMYK